MCLIRPAKRSLFGIHDIEGVRLLTRLPVEFNDLRENKFTHDFQCSSPVRCCQTLIENNEHFLLHRPRFSNHRRNPLDIVSNVVDVDSENLSSIDLCNLLLYDNSRFSVDTNHHIIKSTIFFIKSASRFKLIQTNC